MALPLLISGSERRDFHCDVKRDRLLLELLLLLPCWLAAAATLSLAPGSASIERGFGRDDCESDSISFLLLLMFPVGK